MAGVMFLCLGLFLTGVSRTLKPVNTTDRVLMGILLACGLLEILLGISLLWGN